MNQLLCASFFPTPTIGMYLVVDTCDTENIRYHASDRTRLNYLIFFSTSGIQVILPVVDWEYLPRVAPRAIWTMTKSVLCIHLNLLSILSKRLH